MRTVKKMNIVEARLKLTTLAKEMGEDGTIEISKRGKPVMVLLPYELYEALVETVDIMSDPQSMKALKEGIKEFKAKKTISWEEAKWEIEQ